MNHMEMEFKFALSEYRYNQLLLEYTLVKSRSIVSTYFDTEKLDLYYNHMSLKVKEKSPTMRVISFKSRQTKLANEPWTADEYEHTIQLKDYRELSQDPARILSLAPECIQDKIEDILRERPLMTIGVLVIQRSTVLIDGMTILFDQVELENGHKFYELEIETDSLSSNEAILSFAEKWGLKQKSKTKYGHLIEFWLGHDVAIWE